MSRTRTTPVSTTTCRSPLMSISRRLSITRSPLGRTSFTTPVISAVIDVVRDVEPWPEAFVSLDIGSTLLIWAPIDPGNTTDAEDFLPMMRSSLRRADESVVRFAIQEWLTTGAVRAAARYAAYCSSRFFGFGLCASAAAGSNPIASASTPIRLPFMHHLDRPCAHDASAQIPL